METCEKCGNLHMNIEEDCLKLDPIKCEVELDLNVEYGDLRDWFYIDQKDPNSEKKIINFSFGLVFKDKSILEIKNEKIYEDFLKIEYRMRILESNKQVIAYFFSDGKLDYYPLIKGDPILSFPITLKYTITNVIDWTLEV